MEGNFEQGCIGKYGWQKVARDLAKKDRRTEDDSRDYKSCQKKFARLRRRIRSSGDKGD